MKKILKKVMLSLIFGAMAISFFSCSRDEGDEKSVVNNKKTTEQKEKGKYVFTYDDGEVLNILSGVNFYDTIRWRSIVGNKERFNAPVILDYYDERENITIISDENKNSFTVHTNYDKHIVFNDVTEIPNGVKFTAMYDKDKYITFTMNSDNLNLNSFWATLHNTNFLSNPFSVTQSCLDPASWVAIGIFLATITCSEIVAYCQRKMENEVAECNAKKQCARRTRCGATCYNCGKN